MKNIYSISELVKNIYSYTLTKIFFKNARLIRRPVYIRGRKYCMDISEGFTTGYCCRFDLAGKDKTLIIGKNCQLGDYTHIVAHKKVVIGEDVLMASKVFISDTSHGIYTGEKCDTPNSVPKERALVSKEVKIGNRVWLGENVVVLSGVVIGDGCIIGANSVVNRNIPANSIAVGAPARVVKEWNTEKNIWESI